MWQNRLLKRIEILVNVKNAAVNHLDIVEASGSARENFLLYCHGSPVMNFGVIEEVGKDVTSFKAGDAVFGNSQSGAYAADML